MSTLNSPAPEPSEPTASTLPVPASVQSVDRALWILELLADHGNLTAAELAGHLGVHRSTAFRLLTTLESRQFVAQDRKVGSYALGVGAARVGGAVLSRVDFSRESQAICDEVMAHLGETSNVAILIDGSAVNIAQATGLSSVSVRNQYIGQRTPLHATSSGKVLLADAGAVALEEVLAGGLESFSEHTITEAGALRRELSLVRERGWGSVSAEWQEDVNAAAVPVLCSDGSVAAALSITGPSFRMPEDSFPRFASELRRFAHELSRRAGL